MENIELLAPAGDYECFLAAIHAGADAVYLGGNYSARAYAKNFSDEEILAAIDYAHLYGKKVYMTLNTVLKDDELQSVYSYILPFYKAGLDGVIVQDIGLVTYLRKHFFKLPIHASTQMSITDCEGVRFMSQMGIERVVLARELSLQEIKKIKTETGMELECFIHGALCYSYSGKCLFSSFLGGRSGNRGRCAQPCRLPYNDEYLLSCKDICTLSILPKLIEAGITSYKIEGRMKSPDYVAGVVGIYRKYMDMYQSGKPYQVNQKDLDLLLKLYTRSGNSEGYYLKKNGREMITLNKPGYAKADEAVRLKAYETYTAAFNKLRVCGKLQLKIGEPANLCLQFGDVFVEVLGGNVEKAQKAPLSEETIVKQMNKTGGTEFTVDKWELSCDSNVFMPVAALNELRRAAFDKLRNAVLQPYRRTIEEQSDNNPVSFNTQKKDDFTSDSSDILLHVEVENESQALAAASTHLPNMLSLPIEILHNNGSEVLDKISHIDDSVKILIRFPYIVRKEYFSRHKSDIEKFLEHDSVCGVLAPNYETIGFLLSEQYKGRILGDLHLYCTNREAAATLHNLFLHTTMPVEMHNKELLARDIYGEDAIIYGRVPLMISAQCIQNTCFGCNQTPKTLSLTDRYQVSFPVGNYCKECYNVIWNSVPISLHNDIKLLKKLRPASFRLRFTTETDADVKKRISLFSDIIEERGEAISVDYEYTKGHFHRGVE